MDNVKNKFTLCQQFLLKNHFKFLHVSAGLLLNSVKYRAYIIKFFIVPTMLQSYIYLIKADLFIDRKKKKSKRNRNDFKIQTVAKRIKVY